jgi:AcrR family transcriptional regulator
VATVDTRILEGARLAAGKYGWEGATLERIAEEAGMSRMTLHRHGATREAIFEGLRAQFETAYRERLWPSLTADGDARERLAGALAELCSISEDNLELLEALGRRADSIFHEPGEGSVDTREPFTEAVARLLRDGSVDGSLGSAAPDDDATVLVNLVGHTYRHLRLGHRWPVKRARDSVVRLALGGVSAQ